MVNMKQKYTKTVKYFNNLIKDIIFQLTDKTNKFFKKIIFKLTYKTNKFFKNNSKISNFNKLIISFISLLFLYLFYLSLPTLYDKTWVQNTIENKLLEDFKINFSISSNISYNILPQPHFLIKNSKIFKDNDEKPILLAEIKNLKVLISQKNFFKKEKINITEVLINEANFSFKGSDFQFLNKVNNKKFSSKKIKISNSNIFFKAITNETIAIIKISKAILFYDNLNLLNLLSLNGEVFQIPFIFNIAKQPFSSKDKEINIIAKKLKLNILNKSDNLATGSNIISILNSKIHTQYNIKKNTIFFKSDYSKMKNYNVTYNGKMSLKPFDFKLDVEIKKNNLLKLLNIDSNIIEFIKTKILFNENISASISIKAISQNSTKIFNSVMIYFNIINGKINIDQTILIDEKIGLLKINNSNLFYKNDKLILNTDVVINIKDSNNLFSYLQTPKKHRKPLKNILVNLDYDFSINQIKFNTIKIDNVKTNNEMIKIIEDFNNLNKNINLYKNRLFLNKLLSVYDG